MKNNVKTSIPRLASPAVAIAYRQRGLSLIELMMAVTLGMMLMAGVSSLFSATMGSSSDSLRMMHTSQELRTSADLIASELHRTGYWSGITTAALGTPLPYGLVDVTASCILYSYDDTATALSYRGFRLKSGAIEWLRHAAADADFSCASTSADWQPITDAKMVSITALSFADKSQCINATPATPTDCNTCSPTYTPWALGNTLVNTRQVSFIVSGKSAMGTGSAVFTMEDSIVTRNEEYGSAAAAGPAAGTGCGQMIALLKLTPPS